MKELSLGQKIKKFRKRAGLSQMELELEIGASPGSISRIENGQVNPTKETIITIAEILKLTNTEIAYLFSIPVDSYINKTLNLVNSFTTAENVDAIMQTAVNEIAEKLNYISVCIFLLNGDKLEGKYINDCIFSRRAMQAAGTVFEKLSTTHEDNLCLKSAKTGEIYSHNDLYYFGVGAIHPKVLKFIQKLIGMKSAIAIPLKYNKKSFGSLYLCKKDENDYSLELPVITALADQLAATLSNARLIEELQSQVKQLSKTIQ